MLKSKYLKASRTKVLQTFPTNNFGNEGDIVVSMISGKGTYLCTKAGGRWHTAEKLKSLKELGKTVLKNVSTRNVKIRGIRNAKTNTDKFVVVENDNLKYRNSEELLSDLDSDALSINYKTAYCSLGQYNNKEECESGGGTWYYSENDSHDSISSVAENELLTVGSSIGKVDAESTLTYDGSTLEIKYNSEFDDNWQTSAQTNLLKLSYDSSNYSTFDVGSGGNLTLDTNGDIELNADGGDITFKDSTVQFAKFSKSVGTDFYLYNVANVNDYFNITVGAEGVTTLSTVDADTTVGHLTFDVDGDITLEANGGNINMHDGSNTLFQFDVAGVNLKIMDDADTGDYFNINVGLLGSTKMTTVDDGGANAHIELEPDGKVILDPGAGTLEIKGADVEIDSEKKLFFDGGSNTYISEYSGDVLRFTVGALTFLDMVELASESYILPRYAIGWTQIEPTFDATDTEVDFRGGNKQKLTLTNNVTDIHFQFPHVSGNFICVLLQDGTGGRTISNWKTKDADGNAGAGNSGLVLWAGGTAPSNTETADKSDIASFYWDADNEIAYGTYTYNF